MLANQTISDIFKNVISITDFNRGKGSKIIDEVKHSGYKVIMKNNKPEAVLITPQQFEEMLMMKDEIIEMQLAIKAYKRMAADNQTFISHDNVMKELNIMESDLNDTEID